MFSPNLKGSIQKVTGRDVHGRPQLGEKRDCLFSVVNLSISATKTPVRADSSASRGSARETKSDLARILVDSGMSIENGDIFEFDGIRYELTAVQKRYAVSGVFDHWEVEMGLFTR